ncbi:unnamed protein product, partial [Mesorhabditis spiculigera]
MRDSGFVEPSAHGEEEDTMGQLRSFDMNKGKFKRNLVDKGFQNRPPPVAPNLLARRTESRRATCPEIWLFPETSKPVKRVVLRVYGNSCVGKKTLCQQIHHHAAKATPESVNILSAETEESGKSRTINFLLNGEEVQLEILLESALETSPFSPHVTMFMVVYSVTSRESFQTAADLLYRIFQHRKTTAVPVLLVGNKVDLKRKQAVSAMEGKTLAKIYKCTFLELSALMAMNVDTMWKDLLTQIGGNDGRSILERLVDRGKSIARSCEEIVQRMRRGEGLGEVKEARESLGEQGLDEEEEEQEGQEDEEQES